MFYTSTKPKINEEVTSWTSFRNITLQNMPQTQQYQEKIFYTLKCAMLT